MATTSGPYASGPGGDAFWSQGYIAEWEASNALWTVGPGGQPSTLPSLPAGALLASPAARGSSMVIVADDALWLENTAADAPAVQVAGPLFSTLAPQGYYGEVDWQGTFAWSAAGGPRQGSAWVFDDGLFPQDVQLP